MNFQLIMFALLGGVLPAIFWLVFWLREDRAHPEPKKIIVETFMAGMSCVIIVWPLQHIAEQLISFANEITLGIWIAWAAIEEIVKWGVCYFVALRRKEDDEPIDAVIYMIILALGFTALENTLYILSPLIGNDVLGAYMSGGSRFIGASLLHVLSSAIVGIFIAFSFYKPGIHMKINTLMGLFLATIVHTLFNISMLPISEGGLIENPNGGTTLLFFSLVWMGIIGIIVVLEKIKTLEINTTVVQ